MDPISDMLTRIRNAQAVGHRTVSFPYSKIKFSIANILADKGIIKDVSTQGRKVRKIVEIQLKYKDEVPAITNLKRISKPGRRVCIKKDEIKPVRQGFGFLILSTSAGLMTDQQARRKGLGGEVICEIY